MDIFGQEEGRNAYGQQPQDAFGNRNDNDAFGNPPRDAYGNPASRQENGSGDGFFSGVANALGRLFG